MTPQHDSEFALHDLIARIEAMDAAGIDPDFDNGYEQLKWEFACLRLQCGDQ
jgi:hypothetical protein